MVFLAGSERRLARRPGSVMDREQPPAKEQETVESKAVAVKAVVSIAVKGEVAQCWTGELSLWK